MQLNAPLDAAATIRVVPGLAIKPSGECASPFILTSGCQEVINRNEVLGAWR